MAPRSEPQRSRRERPAKPAFTRAGIIAAAMEITRAEGLQKLTMRRLAEALDTGPASLYVYVANTAELHAAVLDELLAGVDQTPEGGDWRARLEAVLSSYTELLFAHPSLARSALTARPSGAHYLNLIETLLALMDEGGVPPAQAAWGVDVLLLVATATAAEQSSRDQNDGAARDDWDALTRAVRGAPEETHPHVRGLAGALLAGAPTERLAWSFRTLMHGIAHNPVPEAARPGD